ncbi:unnamed protein product [Protopolystoma xenopodis]|uniref:Uncharacterized protein n=1 Tax=Protopolystoma xenopodis TaxID=117903 RepID=A0A3S5CUJ1_9PLAT|nr:unnamed protein product [Protopolystoma xenopodis]
MEEFKSTIQTTNVQQAHSQSKSRLFRSTTSNQETDVGAKQRERRQKEWPGEENTVDTWDGEEKDIKRKAWEEADNLVIVNVGRGNFPDRHFEKLCAPNRYSCIKESRSFRLLGARGLRSSVAFIVIT